MAINGGKKRREMFGNSFLQAGLFLVLTALTACGPQAPEWIEGQSPQFAHEEYLTAVGSAPEAEEASQRARDTLLEKLAAEIAAAEKVRPALPPGIAGEIQAGSMIAKTWRDPEKRRVFALAVLSRQAAAKSLQSHLQALDQRMTESLLDAESADNALSRLERYREARKTLLQRHSWAAALRAVQPGSTVGSAPVTVDRLQEKISDSIRRLTFGVQMPEEGGSAFETGLVRGLARFGMRLGPDWDRDLLMRAQLRSVECDRIEADSRCTAQAVVDVLGRRNEVLKTLQASIQQRSASQADARTRTLAELGNRISQQIVESLREN